MAASVLVVDDDPNLVRLMTKFLKLEGFAPASAGNGREALDYLRGGGGAQVILLDLRMPVMDGWTFRREQRRHRARRRGVVSQADQLSRGGRRRPPPVRRRARLAALQKKWRAPFR